MRRKDREITDFSKMLDIMKTCDCCRIGLVDGNEVYIVPLNFGYEEEANKLTLYFHSAQEGKKIALIKKQKKITFEMDTKHELVKSEHACQFSYLYQSIIGKGYLQILNDSAEKINGLQKIMAHYTNKENWEFNSKFLDMLFVLKLEVSEWSCKEH